MQAPKAWPLFQEYLTPIGVVFFPFNLTFSMCTVIENLDYVLELHGALSDIHLSICWCS
jgi:hypothetical protein